MTAIEINKEIGILWKDISSEDKKEYIEMGEADKKRYVVEIARYNMQSAKQIASRSVI